GCIQANIGTAELTGHNVASAFRTSRFRLKLDSTGNGPSFSHEKPFRSQSGLRRAAALRVRLPGPSSGGARRPRIRRVETQLSNLASWGTADCGCERIRRHPG